MQVGNGHIDQLDPQKWRDNAAQAIDEKILTKQGRGSKWSIAHATQRQPAIMKRPRRTVGSLSGGPQRVFSSCCAPSCPAIPQG